MPVQRTRIGTLADVTRLPEMRPTAGFERSGAEGSETTTLKRHAISRFAAAGGCAQTWEGGAASPEIRYEPSLRVFARRSTVRPKRSVPLAVMFAPATGVPPGPVTRPLIEPPVGRRMSNRVGVLAGRKAIRDG